MIGIAWGNNYMSIQNSLQPPKPPKTLEGDAVKRGGFFSQLMFSLGLKHEHVEDFNRLSHLRMDTPDPAIDEALNYESTTQIEETPVKEEIKTEIIERIAEKPKPKIIEQPRSFVEDVQSPLERSKPGYFSQDTEYNVKKTLAEEFSSFEEESKTSSDKTWLNETSKEDQSMGDFARSDDRIDYVSEKKESAFSQNVEGDIL